MKLFKATQFQHYYSSERLVVTAGYRCFDLTQQVGRCRMGMADWYNEGLSRSTSWLSAEVWGINQNRVNMPHTRPLNQTYCWKSLHRCRWAEWCEGPGGRRERWVETHWDFFHYSSSGFYCSQYTPVSVGSPVNLSKIGSLGHFTSINDALIHLNIVPRSPCKMFVAK